MLKVRVIPVLLLGDGGLVKTTKFKAPKYVGDAINAVKIFNEKEVDELIMVDILASQDGRVPDMDFITEIATECFMPVCYGGGISNIDQITKIFKIGIEKISLNSAALKDLSLVAEASNRFGSQSIVVTMDVKKSFLGKYTVCSDRGNKSTGMYPVDYAKKVEQAGAGEIMVYSVNNDGVCSGYDLSLIEEVSNAVNIPVIACGGAGKIEDFKLAVDAGASAVAAGSQFVFVGKHKAVLITYPNISDLDAMFGGK